VKELKSVMLSMLLSAGAAQTRKATLRERAKWLFVWGHEFSVACVERRTDVVVPQT
jgi:hypothetical protein